MRILFVSAEVAPFAKVGGLADVAGALPKSIRAQGHDIRIIMPCYALVDERQHHLQTVLDPFPVASDTGPEPATVKEGRLGDVPVYFVQNARYFHRDMVYGYPDDLDRFTYFCRATVEAARRLGFQPDIVHCHDWHTAILPAWTGTILKDDPLFRNTASVFTIHNLAFQGWFDEQFRARWDLVPRQAVEHSVDGVSLYSTMALAIRYADVVNTVSETYAREILTPQYGENLDPLLRAYQHKLFGIINGIDYEFFNPATDRFIARNYDVDSLDRKVENKLALQRETGLTEGHTTPLIGVVGRLTDQKGFDLVAEVIDPLLEETTAQFVLLGTGDERYHRLFAEMERRHPSQAKVYIKFDAALAQRIYAGADIFLMPSRFEPCGLGQLISLRYGTVPLVRATGGLADTVIDYDPGTGNGTGFVFRHYNPFALAMTIGRALEVYRDQETWRAIMARGMRQDVSWNASARKYEELYHTAMQRRREAAGQE